MNRTQLYQAAAILWWWDWLDHIVDDESKSDVLITVRVDEQQTS